MSQKAHGKQGTITIRIRPGRKIQGNLLHYRIIIGTWLMKEKKHKVKWKILKKTKSPDYLTDRCYLCLEEATRILRFPPKQLLLNKRSKITAKCMHQRELLIKYIQ